MFDMLPKTGMLGCKAADAPIKANVKLLPHHEILDDPDWYRRLVGKLNCLIINKHDVAFVVSVVSQFLSVSMTTHWHAVVRFSCT